MRIDPNQHLDKLERLILKEMKGLEEALEHIAALRKFFPETRPLPLAQKEDGEDKDNVIHLG